MSLISGLPRHSQYGKVFKTMDYTMKLRGKMTTAAEVYNNLIEAINNLYNDVMETGFIDATAHPEECINSSVTQGEPSAAHGECYLTWRDVFTVFHANPFGLSSSRFNKLAAMPSSLMERVHQLADRVLNFPRTRLLLRATL